MELDGAMEMVEMAGPRCCARGEMEETRVWRRSEGDESPGITMR